MSSIDTRAAGKRLSGLRATALAAIFMLLLEYTLGVLTQLYGRAPAGDHGLPVFAAFWAAITDGPVPLAIHAGLGTLLVVTAVTVLVRAVAFRHAAAVGFSIAALVCILGAWFAGSSLVGDYGDGLLQAMAFAAAAAIGCYTIIVFLGSSAQRARGGGDSWAAMRS